MPNSPPYQRRRFGMLAKVESIYGTDAVPTVGANGVRLLDAFEPNTAPAFPNIREAAATGTLGRAKSAIPRGNMASLAFVAELRGTRAGTAYAANNLPPLSPILQACGYKETGSYGGGVETVTYTPDETGAFKSCTVYYYWGNKFYAVTGCRGTGRLVCTPGQLVRFEGTLQGMLAVETELDLPSITSYGTAEALAAVGLTLAIGAFSPDRYEELTLDLGADVVRADSGNATDGIAAFDIAGFDPRLTLRTRVVELGDYDPYADALARTLRAISYTIGGTQYAKLEVDLPNAEVQEPGLAEQSRFAGYSLEYRLPWEPGDTLPTLTFE